MPGTPRADLDEAELNTVGYVVSRYGRLSGRDLELLSHHEDPWMRADSDREPHGTARIEHEWLRAWFSQPNDEDGPALDRDVVRRWLRRVPADPEDTMEDDVESLRRAARLS